MSQPIYSDNASEQAARAIALTAGLLFQQAQGGRFTEEDVLETAERFATFTKPLNKRDATAKVREVRDSLAETLHQDEVVDPIGCLETLLIQLNQALGEESD